MPLIKNFFYEMFLILTEEFKIDSQNRRWNYANRKWNYFSYFQPSDKKTKCVSFLGRSSNEMFKEEIEASK